MSRLHIIMYHYVREIKNSKYPEIKGLEYKLFLEQLDFLQKEFKQYWVLKSLSLLIVNITSKTLLKML